MEFKVKVMVQVDGDRRSKSIITGTRFIDLSTDIKHVASDTNKEVLQSHILLVQGRWQLSSATSDIRAYHVCAPTPRHPVQARVTISVAPSPDIISHLLPPADLRSYNDILLSLGSKFIRLLVWRVGAHGRVVFGTTADRRRAAVAEMPPPQGSEPLLLGLGVDVRADDEGHEVEERNPHVFGEELLRESQADGRGDPSHPHDPPEAHPDGGPHLRVRLGAGDEGHGDEVYRVLDGSNLYAEKGKFRLVTVWCVGGRSGG
jgi:hypothetical protein